MLPNIPIQVKASLAVLSAQLAFSGWHIVGSVAFRGGTDPLVFILYRLIIGTALMHLYIRVYKMNSYIEEADHKRMFLCGVLSFLQVLCGTLSLTQIAPSRFAIFQPCIPCTVAAISMVFRLEVINYIKLCGIAVAVTGAFVAELWKLGGDDNSADEPNVPLGVFLAVMQVFTMSALLIVVKPLLNKYEPAVVSAMYFIVSTLGIVVLVFCRIDLIPVRDYAFDGKLLPWLAIWYVAIFATMYSFSAINWGGKYLPPTVTTVFFTFQPVGTIILSATLLGSVVTVPEIVGGLLIIAGLIITSFAQSKGGGGGGGLGQVTRVPSGTTADLSDLSGELETVPHRSGAFVELTSQSSSFNPMQSESYSQLAEQDQNRIDISNKYVFAGGDLERTTSHHSEINLMDL